MSMMKKEDQIIDNNNEQIEQAEPDNETENMSYFLMTKLSRAKFVL